MRDRLASLAYGAAYDAVVEGFGPYQRLLGEVMSLVARSCPVSGGPAATRVLDVSCGTGTVVARLAQEGYSVVGVDQVERLVRVAQRRCRRFPNARIGQGDVSAGIPDSGSFDVLVSMHTLYWHPAPGSFLDGCRRALREGGHGVFLTYRRPARVARTFRQIRALEGWVAAVYSLRWLLPTAAFEALRTCEHRYVGEDELCGWLERAGFQVLEARGTFLAGISLLTWTRRTGPAQRE